MDKLRLTVFNTQPPHLFFGGVERRILEIGKRLLGKVNTIVYCGMKAGFRKRSSIDNIDFIPSFSTDFFFPVDNWFFNRAICKDPAKYDSDVFEAHTVSGYGFVKAIQKQTLLNVPFVQTIHGVLADEYVQSSKSVLPTVRMKLANLIMRYISQIEGEVARKATLVVTVSRYSAMRTTQLYFVDEDKIRIVSNGVDIDKFKPFRVSVETKNRIGLEGKKCILFVGRLIPRKGLHFLIDAASSIIKESGDVKFVIVGDGPLRNNLINYVKKCGLSEYFIFLGDVSDRMLPILYNCADLYVSPSIQEGQGLVLLEAQATAIPVVAFNVGGVSESIEDKRTGFLVEPGSNGLADFILELLSNEKLRHKMGRNARDFVIENFSWDVTAQKMFNVYSEAREYVD